MAEFPFQLVIKRSSPVEAKESLLCTSLLRSIPGRREVYDARWNDKSVIAKVFSHKIRARRHLKREWRGLSRLQDRGLNSPKPLFCGKTESGRWAVVLEKIVDSATAFDALNETTDKDKKLDLLVRVCRELAKQHSKGVLQKDLHLRNFLLAGDRIYALDPRQMEFFSAPLSRKKSVNNLAMLVGYVPAGDTASVGAICKEYFQARGWNVAKSDEALLQKQSAAHKKRVIRGGLKKCLRTNRRHLKIKDRRYAAECDRDFCHETEMNDFIQQVDALMAAGQILKNGQTSCVSRLTWNGKDVVVKRYNHRGLIHSLRHTAKRSRACRAWLHGHRLGMLEISTPKPLAYIEQRKGRLVWKSYLVTEYVEGRRLHDFLHDDRVSYEQRLAATGAVVRLLERLWKYRITHGDLKHTNVLVTRDGPVLTDLDGMAVHRWKLLYKNKRTKDMERFLKEEGSLPVIDAKTQRPISAKEREAHRLADDFDKTGVGDWAIRIHKDFPKQSIAGLLSVNDPEAEGEGPFARVPSSDYTRVFKCHLSANGQSPTLYMKQYLYRSRLDFVKHLLRASRAKRAFQASLMLRKNGFDAPDVIGLFERCFGPFALDNMLVTKEVENATPMPQRLREMCRRSDAEALVHKRALIRAFAETIGQMHARGIFHGDLRLGNVLVVKEQENWRFYFIDNERTRKCHRLPARLRLKNLLQVNMFYANDITNTDRMRFFRAYLSMSSYAEIHYRRWARKVIAKTNRRLRKSDRN
jgi:tRNA A-37 threonylcarbamoyl transferase component Bud32